MPPLNLSLGLMFPELPHCISILKRLEQIFVSARIAFMRIIGLGNYGPSSKKLGQLSLHGNVVNVPVSVDSMVSILPRQMSDTQTIQIKLFRRMMYKDPYIYETVRPEVIYNAVKFLCETPLYKQHNITVSPEWLDQFNNKNETAYDVSKSDEESDSEKEIVSKHSGDSEISNSDLSNSYESSTETDNEIIINKKKKKKVKKITDIEKEHANTDTILDCRDPSDIAIKFAPGENKIPSSIIYDENCEELSFPSIYCGQKITDRVSYTDRIKSELRMFDSRACIPDKIFYNYKVGQTKRIADQINICLRKKTSSHTASNLQKESYINNLISTDSGYRFLECERNSPPFLQKLGKNIKALVRQRGIPSLFITVTAAETKWPALLISLMKRQKNKLLTSKEALALPYHEKAELIRKDPVTCARYFDMRTKKLISILKRKDGVFKDNNLEDYILRTEFQNRGSPHNHGLFYLENTPRYIKGDKKSHDRCVEFIDKYITCKYDDSIPELMQYQNHKHSFTCYKHQKGKRLNAKKIKKKCRFNLPRFPMPYTCILEPFDEGEHSDDDIAQYKQNLKLIEDDLIRRLRKKRNKITKMSEKDLNDTFEQFLEKLNLNIDQYILAIRSGLNDARVFLNRKLNEIMINNYNREILILMGSNMDIQFVLNIWSCVEYIVNYVSKSEKHMSKTLMDCVKSLNQGDCTIKEKLRRIANSFLGATETSAQECVFLELGLNLTFSSRSFVFINTSLPEKRQHLVKSKKLLATLSEDSTDVFLNDILFYYVRRPLENVFFKKMCLADFVAEYNIVNFSSKKIKIKKEISDSNDSNDENKKEEDNNNMEFNNVNDTFSISSHSSDDESNNVDKKENYKNISLPRIRETCKYLNKRNKSRIIRYAHFNIKQTPEDYYREQCMLFLSWENEETDILLKDKQKLYFDNIKSINEIKEKYVKFENENIIEEIELQKQNINYESSDDEEQENIESDYAILETEAPEIDIYQTMGTETHKKSSLAENFKIANQMSFDQFEKLILSFNTDQRKYFYHVMTMIKTQDIPFYEFLNGQGGVGKTRLLLAFVQSIDRFYNSFTDNDLSLPNVLVCAYTGKACSALEGCMALTFHSAFGLPIDIFGGEMPDLSQDVANTLFTKLKNLKIMFFDEISMVGGKMFIRIHKRCQQIFRNNLFFGGLSLIVSGEFWQLAQMYDHRIFTAGNQLMASLHGPILWELFKYFSLTEIMRQKDDLPFAIALGKLAKSERLTDEELMSFRSCETTVLIDDTQHLFVTNLEKDNYNINKMLSVIAEETVSTAVDICMGTKSHKTKEEELKKFKLLPLEKSAQLPYELHLKISIRYMCTINIDLIDGIVNGSTGILKKISYDTNGNASIIWIEFPDKTGTNKMKKFQELINLQQVDSNWVPFYKEQRSIQVRKEPSTLTIQRTQFPYHPSEGITIFKSQGGTFKEVTVTLYHKSKERLTKNEINKNNNTTSRKKPELIYIDRCSLYVAASRCVSQKGLKFIGKNLNTNSIIAFFIDFQIIGY